MFGKDSGDVHILCPYDNTHYILAKSFNAHLVKCRENHPGHRMAVCKFDQTHRVPKPELPHHLSECPSRYLLDRELQLKAGGNNMLSGDVKGPPIVAQYVDETEEDWDSAPAYSASHALFNKGRARNEKAEEGATGLYIPPGANYATEPSRAATQPSSSQTDSEGTFRRMPLAPSRAAQMSAEVRPQPGSGSEVYSYSVGSKDTGRGSGYGRGRGMGLQQAPPNVGVVHPFSYPTSNMNGSSPSSSVVSGMEPSIPGSRGGANFVPGGPYSQVPGFPGQMPIFQGQMPDFQGQMPDFQGPMPRFSNQIPQFSGQMQRFPGQMQRFPGQMQHFSSQNPGFSDRVPGFPGQVPRSQLPLQPPRIPQVDLSSPGGASDWNRSVQYEDSFSTMPDGQLQQQETLQREDLLQQRYQLGQQQRHLQQLQHQQKRELDMQQLQQTFTPLAQGRGHSMPTISSQNNIVPGTVPETRPLPVGRGASHDFGRLRTPASSSRAQAIQEQKDIQSGVPVTEIQKDHAENEDDEQWCDYDTATYASALQASRPHNDSPAAVADPGGSKPADTGNEGSVMDMVSSWLDQQKLDDTAESVSDSKYSGKDFSQLSKEDLQKTKRRLEKKLKQIAVLEQKVTAGEKLSQEEESKLQKKRDIVLELDKIAALL